MTLRRRTKTEIHNQGWNAYLDGESHKANPYKYPSWRHDEWYLGYHNAREVVEAMEKE